MVKKIKTKDNGHKCGDCILSTWVEDFNHKDHYGKPICKKCPIKDCYVLRNESACDAFKMN